VATGVTFNGVILEAAIISDEAVAVATFMASVVELATISDLLLGRPLWEIIDDVQNADWGNITNTQTAGWQNIDDTQSINWQNINNTQSSGWAQVDDTQSAGWTPIDTN
jgi:hypothetical protein